MSINCDSFTLFEFLFLYVVEGISDNSFYFYLHLGGNEPHNTIPFQLILLFLDTSPKLATKLRWHHWCYPENAFVVKQKSSWWTLSPIQKLRHPWLVSFPRDLSNQRSPHISLLSSFTYPPSVGVRDHLKEEYKVLNLMMAEIFCGKLASFLSLNTTSGRYSKPSKILGIECWFLTAAICSIYFLDW